MASPLETLSRRASYGLAQGSRVAWYVAHGYAMGRLRRLAEEAMPRMARAEAPQPTRPVPPQRVLWRDLARLFARDLANVEAGHYPMPRDEDGLGDRLDRSLAFFADLPRIFERRRTGAHQEVFAEARRPGLPRYYLQNFHFQTGGYLSEESARIYDVQVEVLFNGTANAMRRQALVPIATHLRGRDQRHMAMADIACGTGRFLRMAREAFPGLRTVGIDLSEAYAREARRHAGGRGRGGGGVLVAKAEALPLADASQDIVSSIFLFHELPPKVRREVAAEFARVLKPGGIAVFMDSLQLGDVEGYDGLLERFPHGFHEPYYASYIREDLTALFQGAGLDPVSSEPMFVSRLMVLRKPADGSGDHV